MSIALAILGMGAIPFFGTAIETNIHRGEIQQLARDRVLSEFVTTASAAETRDESSTKWTCPMHPHYIADEFGSCPICGMDLVKLETPGEAQGETSAESRSAITIAPETIQNMGVRIAKAENSSFGRVIRSFGRVAENERKQSELTARTEGWIEDLRIRAVGDQVKKGDLLFTIYAPEFIITQRDYIASRKGRDRSRINSIKTRLRAFGMQDRTIKELAKRGSAFEFVPFYAEQDGTVAVTELRPGSYVKRGTMMTRIQDYTQVWLMVSVPEKDLSFINVGTPAKVTFPNIPGRELFSRVEYVYPTVDPKTRTGQVRLVVENPDGQLRPGAYADVAFEVGTQQRLAVPTEAILKSGRGRYVIASLGKGRFEPRSVKVGLTSGRWSEVSGEIKSGDDIVVSGQFLIDSESALRESFQKLQRLQLPLSLLKLDKTQFAMIDHLIDAALYIHEALIDGYDVDPGQLKPAIEIKTLMWPKFQHTRLAYVMTDAVAALKKAQNAKAESEVRETLAELLLALEPWLLDGAPQHYKERKVELYKDSKSGKKWVQMAGQPANPFGANPAIKIPWPESNTAAESAQTSDAPPVQKPGAMGGSHAGH